MQRKTEKVKEKKDSNQTPDLHSLINHQTRSERVIHFVESFFWVASATFLLKKTKVLWILFYSQRTNRYSRASFFFTLGVLTSFLAYITLYMPFVNQTHEKK